MTEQPNEAQPADEPSATDSDDGGGGVNDPLTRRDVDAPRVPFQSGSSADG